MRHLLELQQELGADFEASMVGMTGGVGQLVGSFWS